MTGVELFFASWYIKFMFEFLKGLDEDLRVSLLAQIRDLWTHTSTALEGNTLTLGDTHFVLEEGLTVSGKPLKDHQEVVGHARALELVYSFVGRELVFDDIYELQKAVQTEVVHDIYKPVGAWKVEPNGTYVVDESGKQVYIEYASPKDVSFLMERFLSEFNRACVQSWTMESASQVYAKIHMGFVHIHPFWDGNGRVARLLANLPLLNCGLPPIVIAKEARRQYIQALSYYQIALGQLTQSTGVWPNVNSLDGFKQFCLEQYKQTQHLVDEALKVQKSREQK